MGLVKVFVLSWAGVRMKWDYVRKSHSQTVKCVIKDHFDSVCVWYCSGNSTSLLYGRTRCRPDALYVSAPLICMLCPLLISQEDGHSLSGQVTRGRHPVAGKLQHSSILKSPLLNAHGQLCNWTYTGNVQKAVGAAGSCFPSSDLFESLLSPFPISLPFTTNQSCRNQLKCCLFHLDFNFNF